MPKDVRIVLFRGVNVGRANRLSMTALREVLEGSGCRDVRTYLQSGNAVLRPPPGTTDAALAARLGDAVAASVAGSIVAFVRSVGDLRSIVDANPFRDAACEPTKLHVFLFAADPVVGADARLADLATARERVAIQGRAAYLHAPDGIGRSKLAARLERTVGVPTTARNWRTVTSLLALAER